MRESSRTTRERLADRLRERAATPSELAATFDISRGSVIAHLEHVARSIDASTGETLEVAPPRCRACGFEAFDDLLNLPSRCPNCKSEDLAEPMVRIT